jgi:hypothetical protein
MPSYTVPQVTQFLIDLIMLSQDNKTYHFALKKGVLHIKLRATAIAMRWQIPRDPCVME